MIAINSTHHGNDSIVIFEMSLFHQDKSDMLLFI